MLLIFLASGTNIGLKEPKGGFLWLMARYVQSFESGERGGFRGWAVRPWCMVACGHTCDWGRLLSGFSMPWQIRSRGLGLEAGMVVTFKAHPQQPTWNSPSLNTATIFLNSTTTLGPRVPIQSAICVIWLCFTLCAYVCTHTQRGQKMILGLLELQLTTICRVPGLIYGS